METVVECRRVRGVEFRNEQKDNGNKRRKKKKKKIMAACILAKCQQTPRMTVTLADLGAFATYSET